MKNKRTNEGRQCDLRKKLRMHQHLPIHVLLWEHLVRSATPSRPGTVLVQKSGHVDDDAQISAMDAFILREKWTKKSSHRRSVGKK